MPNDFGTLSGSLILQKALEMTFKTRPLLKALSMGFRELDGSVDNALLDQSVKSRLIGSASVQTFGTGAQTRTDTDVSVTLNTKKEIHHSFTMAEVNSTDRDLVAESAEPIAIALADHIIASVAALWTSSNFSGSVTKASAWDYDHLRVVRLAAQNAGIPEAKRFYVCNSTVYDSLLGDDMIVSALNNPANAEAIRSGKLPQVMGFQLLEYTDLPGNSQNLVAFAGTPDSTVYVSRAPKSPTELAPGLTFPGNIGYVEDPTTGFRVMVNQWIDADTLEVNNRIVWLEGFAKGNTANGIRVKTS